MKTLKKLFDPGSTDTGLLFIRVALGLLMLTHGLPKFAKFFTDEPIAFASVFGMSQSLSLGLAVTAEVFCPILIVLGLGTRLASLPVAFTMAVAAFNVHFADPFATKELAILYLVGFVFIALVGPGKYSVDYFLTKARPKKIPIEIA